MDVEITKMDGTKTKLSEIGVEVRDFIVSSIELRPIYSAIEGRSGHVNMGADYGARTITVPFYLIHFFTSSRIYSATFSGLFSCCTIICISRFFRSTVISAASTSC